MAKRVSLNDFAVLAISEFKTLDLRSKELGMLKKKFDVCIPSKVWENKVAPGVFRIDGNPEEGEQIDVNPTPRPVAAAVSASVSAPASFTNNGTALAVESYNGIPVYSTPADLMLIPDQDKNFVPWGDYKLIERLLSHDDFLSIYVTGETGNGKTFNFEQAAANLGRELITVNFTAQTDEDDLIGGFRLINGDTVWVDGPVIEAMKRGAILLLDEVDLATEAVMSLQSVLQGKSYYMKKLGRTVNPANGFTIVATANTKGDGDGDYVFTNVLNKAFLDRFKILLEQPYPDLHVERKILNQYIKYNCSHVVGNWVDDVTNFVDVVRNAYKEGSIAEQISTRRLVDMTQMYGLLGDAKEAIRLTTNRFDVETRDAMLVLWDNIYRPEPVVEPEPKFVEPEFADTPVAIPAAAFPQAGQDWKKSGVPF